MDQTDPLQNYRAIRNELEKFNTQLGKRIEIVVVTKAELPGAAEVRDLLATETDKPVFLISSVTGEGLVELTRAIVQELDSVAAADNA